MENPQNIATKRFALNTKEKGSAICCHSSQGSIFRNHFGVLNDCITNTDNRGDIGDINTNDTVFGEMIVFTGSPSF
jgi:hypothetical protein